MMVQLGFVQVTSTQSKQKSGWYKSFSRYHVTPEVISIWWNKVFCIIPPVVWSIFHMVLSSFSDMYSCRHWSLPHYCDVQLKTRCYFMNKLLLFIWDKLWSKLYPNHSFNTLNNSIIMMLLVKSEIFMKHLTNPALCFLLTTIDVICATKELYSG